MKTFLKSKHKVEYRVAEVVPFYKSIWYYDFEKDRNICVVIPLNMILVILRNIYWYFKLFGKDSMNYYHSQFRLREKYNSQLDQNYQKELNKIINPLPYPNNKN